MAYLSKQAALWAATKAAVKHASLLFLAAILLLGVLGLLDVAIGALTGQRLPTWAVLVIPIAWLSALHGVKEFKVIRRYGRTPA